MWFGTKSSIRRRPRRVSRSRSRASASSPPSASLHGVAGDRETRAADVVVSQIGQRFLKLVAPLGDASARSAARRARSATRSGARPSRTPSGRRDRVPRPGCHRVWRSGQAARQVGQPHTGVDLVQHGGTRWCHLRALGSRVVVAPRCTTQTRGTVSARIGNGPSTAIFGTISAPAVQRFDRSTDLPRNRTTPSAVFRYFVTGAPTGGHRRGVRARFEREAYAAEHVRLEEDRARKASWKKWGPYLSERQWGTVREDFSADGNAWDNFTHDQSRSRAYRWGEDGLAGVSDDKQFVCVALALWNGRDPILKERLFGLTNSEGNHGEDVKEYLLLPRLHADALVHEVSVQVSQAAFPYADLIETNRKRGRGGLEYELLDTGVFNDNRYFDVFVEYAKASPQDLLIEITVHNRGPEAATLQVLPTVWFRNTWSWGGDGPRPELSQTGDGTNTIAITHPSIGQLSCHAEGAAELLFTENETNHARVFNGQNRSPYVKDGINDFIVHGRRDAVNPATAGHEGRGALPLTVAAGGSQVVRLRLTDAAPAARDRRRRRPAPGDGLRRGDDRAPARSRRVLRHGDPAVARRGSRARDAAGAGRHAVEQAVLSLRRQHVAGRARRRSVQGEAARAAQPGLAPHAQRRHHFDAGQVGIPVVRRVGPGLPRAGADDGGRGLRQAAARSDAARGLPAPERADPGLRVELRRRQPAGPRLGDASSRTV